MVTCVPHAATEIVQTCIADHEVGRDARDRLPVGRHSHAIVKLKMQTPNNTNMLELVRVQHEKK